MESIENLSISLYDVWVLRYPEMTKEIMSQDGCDIGPEFMCFCDIYLHLSQIIPKHWTVLDLGCAFAPQSWFFKDHAKYIGVDPGKFKRFKTPNASFYEWTIAKFFNSKSSLKLNKDRTFGIMSHVPADDYSYFLAKAHLSNIFIYYPSQDPIVPKFKK